LTTDRDWFAEAVRRSRTPLANLMDDGRHVAWHHVCIGERDLAATVWTVVVLPLGPWRVVSADPLTVEPSIHCTPCGTHGFITDGEWRDVA
jgi:hypothetical protein